MSVTIKRAAAITVALALIATSLILAGPWVLLAVPAGMIIAVILVIVDDERIAARDEYLGPEDPDL